MFLIENSLFSLEISDVVQIGHYGRGLGRKPGFRPYEQIYMTLVAQEIHGILYSRTILGSRR